MGTENLLFAYSNSVSVEKIATKIARPKLNKRYEYTKAGLISEGLLLRIYKDRPDVNTTVRTMDVVKTKVRTDLLSGPR
jgi:hypothetical protein